jgi:hypothetical protein
MSTFTLVQPRARRREWALRTGDEVRAVLRLSTFRSGAEAEAAGRPLSIEQDGWWRPEHVVRDRRTDEEIARLRRSKLELGGRTLTWRRSRFVDESGEPLVAVKIKSGLLRSSGEVTLAAAVPDPDALVMAVLAVYLILRRNAAAAAGATAAVGATSA